MNKTPQISQSKAEVSRVDDQKGAINDLTGIITGEGEGYSRWEEVTPSGTSAVSAAETALCGWNLCVRKCKNQSGRQHLCRLLLGTGKWSLVCI